MVLLARCPPPPSQQPLFNVVADAVAAPYVERIEPILTDCRRDRIQLPVGVEIISNFSEIFLQTGTELSTLSMGQTYTLDGTDVCQRSHRHLAKNDHLSALPKRCLANRALAVLMRFFCAAEYSEPVATDDTIGTSWMLSSSGKRTSKSRFRYLYCRPSRECRTVPSSCSWKFAGKVQRPFRRPTGSWWGRPARSNCNCP